MNEYLDFNEDWVLFRVFQKKQGTENTIGMIEGQLRLVNLPFPCQMKFGIHQDGEINDCALLCEGFYDFSDFKQKKLSRLQEPLHKSYNPSTLPSSPFEIPLSPTFEIEMRQHLEQLKEPLGSWEDSLLFLSTILKDDIMSKEAFLQASGISICCLFLKSYCLENSQNDNFSNNNQNLSICLSRALQTIAIGIEDCKFFFFFIIK